MSASKARHSFDAQSAPQGAPVAPPMRLADGDERPVSSGVHALQAQLEARLQADAVTGSHASPARGLLIAAVPSVLLWWGIASAVRALLHL